MANTPDSQFSRRTLAKGAAWTVPVVAVAAAAPSVAASPTVITTAPEGLALDLTACNAGTLSWTGLPGQTYEVQYRIEGSPDWKPSPPWQVSGTSRLISAGSTEYLREVQVRHYVSDAATSAWVTYTIPTPKFTGVTAQRVVVSNNQFDHRVMWNTLPLAGSYTVRLRRTGEVLEFASVTSPWTGATRNSNQWMTEAQVETQVCGRTITSDWVIVSDANRQVGPSEDARQVGPAQPEASTPGAQFKKPAESLAPASKKSAPTVEPTLSPTPEAVPVVPDPEPIVTKSVVLPEPVPVPTPSA